MWRSGIAVAFAFAMVTALPARAAIDLQTSVESDLGGATLLRLTVVNTGDDNAIDVKPLVAFRGEEQEPEPVEVLAPGARFIWRLEFPLPDAPGAFPATSWIRYRDGYGETFSVPVVHLVGTPGIVGAEVSLDLEATPIGDFGRASVRLHNPGDAAVHGRLVVLLPENLGIEPQSRPAEVPAHGESDVPLVIQNQGATEGSTYPIQALFEYDEGGVHHSALARTAATISSDQGRAPIPPVVVGAAALAAALGLLAAAWSRAAHKRRTSTRAERRRDGRRRGTDA